MAKAFKHIISNSIENMIDNICDFAAQNGWIRQGSILFPPSYKPDLNLPNVSKTYTIRFECLKWSSSWLSYVKPTSSNGIVADGTLTFKATDSIGKEFTKVFTSHEDAKGRTGRQQEWLDFSFSSENPFVSWEIIMDCKIYNPTQIDNIINNAHWALGRLKVTTDNYSFVQQVNNSDNNLTEFFQSYEQIDGYGRVYYIGNNRSDKVSTNINISVLTSTKKISFSIEKGYYFYKSVGVIGSGIDATGVVLLNIRSKRNSVILDTSMGHLKQFKNCWIKIEDDLLAGTIQVGDTAFRHFLIGKNVYEGDTPVTVEWSTAATLTDFIGGFMNLRNYQQYMFGTWDYNSNKSTSTNSAIINGVIHNITPSINTDKVIVGGEAWHGTGVIAQYARADVSNQVLFTKMLFGITNNLSTDFIKWVGSVPIFHIMNMEGIEPAQRINAGKRTFICFPIISKVGSGDDKNDRDVKGVYGTGNGGFAIEIENEVV